MENPYTDLQKVVDRAAHKGWQEGHDAAAAELQERNASKGSRKCENCGGDTIDNCLRCGAPQCCPRCCEPTSIKAENAELRLRIEALEGALKYMQAEVSSRHPFNKWHVDEELVKRYGPCETCIAHAKVQTALQEPHAND